MTKVDPYLHAVLLLHGAGKEVNKDGIMAVIKASGAEADEAKAKVLAEAVKGVDFEDLLKQSVMVAAAPPAAGAVPAAAGGEAKKKEKKEDEGKKEEEAAEGLASLFG